MDFQLIEKLSVRTPAGEVKLKVLKEIAKEHQIDWDTTESEKELLKPPEEPIVRICVLIYLILLCFATILINDWAFSVIRKGHVLLSVQAAYQ